MPLTKKGSKILSSMEETYGSTKKAKQVLYASKNAGKISGVDKKRRKTTQRDPFGREVSTFEEESDSEFCGGSPEYTGHGAQAVGQKKNKKRPSPGNASEDARWLVIYDKLMEDRGRTMSDSISMSDADVQYTDEGYLKAVPRICRTGIQLYGGDECGRPDLKMVRVYRPEDQVFKTQTMHGYARLPITLDHPGVHVSADNWKAHAVGETGDDVTRDGSTVRVPFMLRDAKAVAAFKAGTNQLSVGYTCDLKWQDGETTDGLKYDAVQVNIRPNHLAVVGAARGGPQLTIGDDNKGEDTMTVKMTVDGLQAAVADGQSASIIQKTIDTLKQQLADAYEDAKKRDEDDGDKNGAVKQLQADSKKALETKDGEIAALKKAVEDEKAKTTPAMLNAMAKDWQRVIDKAKILNPKVKTDDAELPDIRRQVVVASMAEAKDWADEKVEGAFNYMASQIKGQTTQMGDVVRNFSQPTVAADARQQAYEDYDREASEAWRKSKSA